MKTEDLIRSLVADAKHSRMDFVRAAQIALGASAGFIALVFALFLGLRPDITSALQSLRFLLKLAVVFSLAIVAIYLVVRAGRPEARFAARHWWAAIPVALLLAGVAGELTMTAPGNWSASLLGTKAVYCLAVIPALSVLPLVTTLSLLRYGAPANPTEAGALAGLFAGGVAATFYAMNCDNDSPLFVAAWYTLAIGFVAAVGAAAGSRLLRW